MSAGQPAGRQRAAAGLAAWAERVLRVSARRPVSLGLVAAIVGVDALAMRPHAGFVARALADEPCHLATAVVALGTLTRWRGRPPGAWFAWPMLAASVLIDVDHLPREFGTSAWTAGTPRPYSHSLAMIAVLAVAAYATWAGARAVGSRRGGLAAPVLAGAACGVAAHFLRDVATAPIALWWPVSGAGVRVAYGWYLGALLVLAVIPPWRKE